MENKKRRLQYSTETLEKAVAAIEAGMPFKTASKTYGIPRATLQDKVKGKSPMGKKSGPETILKKEEELILENWLIYIASCGFPGTKDQLLDSVQILVKNLQRPNNFTDGRPGRRWYEGFMARHPNLTKRVSQNLTSARASLTENRIKQWFKEVETYLKSTNNFEILMDPNRVFNCDETAMFLSPKGDKVLVKKGDKTVYSFINNDEKECLTTLIMCNAAGSIPPPMIVYSYKRIPKLVADKVPKNWGIGRSDTGWMTGESFFEYIANIFHPWLVAEKVKFPVILFLDGHTSHLTLALSEFCSKNNIILVALCPNATHILQPLDVAVFRPLKMEWKKSVLCWRMKNNGQRLGRDIFATILQTTLEKMTRIPDVIKNGFRSCGLVPFNADNIRFLKYFKVPQQNNSSEGIQQTDHGNPAEFLRLLESEIAEDTVKMFKSSRSNWEGSIEDKSLFLLWKKIKSHVEIGPTATYIENTEENTQTTAPETESREAQERRDTLELDITGMLNSDNFTFPIQLDVHDENLNIPDVGTHSKNDIDDEKDREIRSESNIENANQPLILDLDAMQIDLGDIMTMPATSSPNAVPVVLDTSVPSMPSDQIIRTTSSISMLRNLPSINLDEAITIATTLSKNVVPAATPIFVPSALPELIIPTTSTISTLKNSPRVDLNKPTTTTKTASENIILNASNIFEPSTPPEKIIPTTSTISPVRNLARIDLDEAITMPTSPSKNVNPDESNIFAQSTPPEQIIPTTSTISPVGNLARIDLDEAITMPTSPPKNVNPAVSNIFAQLTPPEQIIPTTSTISTLRNSPKNIVDTADIENVPPNNTKTAIIDGIPTPFKKSLFWPEPKSVTKKKAKEKVPAVATSSQWQHYYKSKEEKKRQEEERKMQKQEERKRKLAEIGKKKKKAKTDDSNATAISPILASDIDDDYKLNDFVIAKYNDQFFPGKIIAVKESESGCQYEVTHMEKKGINWFWPEKLDILLYDEAEILKKIPEPVSKNKRGLFTVNEISEFYT